MYMYFFCAVIQPAPESDNNITSQTISSDDAGEYYNWFTAVLARSYILTMQPIFMLCICMPIIHVADLATVEFCCYTITPYIVTLESFLLHYLLQSEILMCTLQ